MENQLSKLPANLLHGQCPEVCDVCKFAIEVAHKQWVDSVKTVKVTFVHLDKNKKTVHVHTRINMAKKQTPGKGGAVGMHHGHQYKETCGCAICKSKRKKLVSGSTPQENAKRILETVTEKEVVPLFVRKDTENEYRVEITYPGITPDNFGGELDEEKKELLVTIDRITDKSVETAYYQKTFKLPELEKVSGFKYSVVTVITGDILTIRIPKAPVQEVALTPETAHLFAQTELAKTEPPKEKPVEQPVNLTSDITITGDTFAVMNAKVRQLHALVKETDHDKFMNKLVNMAIVKLCNGL